VGLAPFVGDNLGAKAFSPAIVVLADEVIEQARAFARGFALDEDAIASHEIAEAGPGGSFLLSASTLRSFRTAHVSSHIFPQLTLEEWQRREQPRAEDFLRQHTRELMETASPPEDHDALLGKGEAFIERWARRGS
jgi:trimethylamine:corrinoid methyltransferase-like protein